MPAAPVSLYETTLERTILDGLSTMNSGYLLDVLPRRLAALVAPNDCGVFQSWRGGAESAGRSGRVDRWRFLRWLGSRKAGRWMGAGLIFPVTLAGWLGSFRGFC